jgi:nitrogen fixation protein FixH
MSTMTLWRTKFPNKLSGLHVLAILVAFFGTIFVVNGVFIFRALSTYTGEVANEPYRKGLAYNARIAAEQRQRELGYADVTTVGRDGTVAVLLRDASGAPLSGVALSGSIGRPSTDRQDHKLAFTQNTTGQFIAHVPALDAGSWIVSLRALREAAANEVVYQAKRRVWLNP